MNKLLPLGVITSMLLTGCGGSDSGGGGSAPAPSKVQMAICSDERIDQNRNDTVLW
ncbi:hypothetical protein ACU5DF_17975 [Aliivibrio wodanis]|uniref:hypothetical protein n=1 Tax=Aliivibrio wodanis TaxID=80852 RepID=UPI00406C2E0E